MEPNALPAWAKEHAATLLADLGVRWQHVCGVARQAQRVSQVLAPEDRPYLVAAAWLHDIGYAPDLGATAFHPIDGARHVRALGHERLARLIAYHSSARWEAEALGLADELAAFPLEDSATSDALTYCDMTTDVERPVKAAVLPGGWAWVRAREDTVLVRRVVEVLAAGVMLRRWWWPSSVAGTTRRGGMDRQAATLMCAGWDRRSAIRRKVPLTSVVSG